MPWTGGIPSGRITSDAPDKHRFIIKKYKHKLHSEIYNPPFHKIYETLDEAEEAQREFNDKYRIWRNRYRVVY